MRCDAQRLRPENSEVERLFGDNARLRALSGWRPEYGGLEGFRRGLEVTIDWFMRPENLATYKTSIYNI